MTWFEREILQVGLAGLVEAVLAILSFGSVLSAVLGGPAMKAAAVVIAVLIVLAMFATLLANRTQREGEWARDRRLVAHYCDVIKHLNGAPLHYLSWDDVTVIDANGDAVETENVHARVEAAEAHFYRFRLGSGWDQPERQRRKVRCDVRTTLVNGAVGPRCDISRSWLADGRLEVLAHLASPVRAGDHLRIQLHLEWPGMCDPLIRQRRPDNFLLRFARPADHVRYVMVLPRGAEPCFDPIGFNLDENGYLVKVEHNATGTVQVVLTAENVPARHRFGLRLDLR